MAENKQRSPGKGKSEKQRAAAAEASFDEMTSADASTDFGNDVKEIRSFTDEAEEPMVQKISPRWESSGEEYQGQSDHESRQQMQGRRSESFSGAYGEEEQEQSGQKTIPEMLSDRVDDLKDYAGHLVNGAFDKLKEEWKYNRKGLIRKAAVTAVVTSAAVALAVAVKNHRRSNNKVFA